MTGLTTQLGEVFDQFTASCGSGDFIVRFSTSAFDESRALPLNCCVSSDPVSFFNNKYSPNGIQIQSAVLPQCTGHTDWHTDHRCSRWQNLYQYPLTLYWLYSDLANNNKDGLHRHCKSSPSSSDECKCRLSTRWPATLRPSHLICDVSLLLGCCRPRPPSPFIVITQPESRCSFTVPRRVEGWVDLDTAWKVQQPEPKTAYHNECCNACHCWLRNLNLGSLTLQQGAPVFVDIGVWSVAVSDTCLCVCIFLSVWLSANISQKPDGQTATLLLCMAKLHQMSYICCNTLCTTSILNDVMFSYHGASGQNQARRYV